jgi:hypothetical protein
MLMMKWVRQGTINIREDQIIYIDRDSCAVFVSGCHLNFDPASLEAILKQLDEDKFFDIDVEGKNFTINLEKVTAVGIAAPDAGTADQKYTVMIESPVPNAPSAFVFRGIRGEILVRRLGLQLSEE